MVTRVGTLRRSLRRPIANVTSVTPKAMCPAKLSVTINKPELLVGLVTQQVLFASSFALAALA
jgi:hypothetical protein